MLKVYQIKNVDTLLLISSKVERIEILIFLPIFLNDMLRENIKQPPKTHLGYYYTGKRKFKFSLHCTYFYQ